MEDLEIHFADAAQLEGRGFKKGFSAFQAKLPEYTGARHHVAIVNTFRKDGRWWRQSQMSEVVQAIATVGDAVVEFTRTPEYRQISNNQWNPWIVFSAPLPRSFSGQDIRFGITSHLPPGVEMATDLWVVREWWSPRTRSLPNYWV
jgi:hypothetical protein